MAQPKEELKAADTRPRTFAAVAVLHLTDYVPDWRRDRMIMQKIDELV
jgi:hypothetical protein